ncbi:MAG: hypothetical protein AVDCRST_MAG67-3048 [uncultured Solirubrobacteraceae bacterium]|uniref:Uncharacterized protein n=1 Tax=uncultured Solirubrobacteraceae bacterium TaxID=1162706 RepID=A0A6J4T658_9ACTN|nr:MAG: hypothetical protein AVDCRST_MAG67-3048 [uncultured Solirubrobacteraceae bacterium]
MLLIKIEEVAEGHWTSIFADLRRRCLRARLDHPDDRPRHRVLGRDLRRPHRRRPRHRAKQKPVRLCLLQFSDQD